MATIDELNIVIAAKVDESGFAKGEAAIGGLGKAAEAAGKQVASGLDEAGKAADNAGNAIAAGLDKGTQAAGRFRDANGRLHEANGKFVTTAQLAAEAAANSSNVFVRSNGAIAAALDKSEEAAKIFEQGFGRAAEKLKEGGTVLTASVTLPLGLLAAAALKAAGDLQALEKGFTATYKGSEPLQDALAKVRELAKLPGLGLTEALQGATNLQAAGLSADLARRSLGAFGNALATVGKGKADLEGVALALGQIQAKGKVSAEEINQLAERVPQIREAMKAAFGTADTEALNKAGISATAFVEGVVTELEKLPKVTGGINNAFENLSDATTIALGKIGTALNENFNIEGVLGQVSDFIADLANKFDSLSPTAQKAVFAIGGLAAAAGPLLIAIGAVGAAIPAIVAGFTLLSGPVGIAAAALGLLAAGTVAYVATSGSATDAFRKQKASVDALEKGINPLLGRYDELKGKTTLTKAEQEELRSIVQKVGDQIPTAITQFDAYGKAMDISTAAARNFVDRQREILAIKNKPALKEQREEYARLTEQINLAQQALSKRDAQGFLVADRAETRKVGQDFETIVTTVRLTDDEIRNLQGRLQDLSAQRRGVGGLIDELKGIQPPLDSATAAAGKTAVAVGLLADLEAKLKKAKEDQGNATNERDLAAINARIAGYELEKKRLEDLGTTGVKIAAAFREFNKEQAQVANLAKVLAAPADAAETTRARISALEGGIKSLINAGATPATAAVQKLQKELLTLQKGLNPEVANITVPIIPEVRIDRTLGDKLGAATAKLLGGYAQQSLTLPVKLDFPVATLDTQLKNILNSNETLTRSFATIRKEAAVFGGSIAGLSPTMQQAQTDATVLAGRAAALKSELQRMIKEGVDPALPGFQLLQQEYYKTAQAADAAQLQINTSLQAAAAGAEVVKGAIVESMAGIGAVLGDALAGQVQDPAKAFVAALLEPLGSMLIDLGKIAIASGIGVEAIKKALSTLQGPGAIVAGIALVALGTAVRGAVGRLTTPSKGGGGGAAVPTSNYAAPRSRAVVDGATASSQPTTITHIVQVDLSGSALRGAIQINTDRFGRVTGRNQ